MKLFVVLVSVFAIAIAQRPGYLGSSPVGYPGLASRFKEDSSTSSASTSSASTSSASSSSTPDVNNRLGESGGATQKIPVDARGDVALVNRVNQWPREHRPFWVLNAEHIEAQRQGGFRGGSQQPDLQTRGNFDDFGNPIETQTILPIQTRGSFAGSFRK